LHIAITDGLGGLIEGLGGLWIAFAQGIGGLF
jgi:hypothetical protein